MRRLLEALPSSQNATRALRRATGSWRMGPAQLEDRGYHRRPYCFRRRVFSGARGAIPTGAPRLLVQVRHAELYSPQYSPRAAAEITRPQDLRGGTASGSASAQRRSPHQAVWARPAPNPRNDMNSARATRPDRLLGTGVPVAQPRRNVALGVLHALVLNAQGVPRARVWVRLAASELMLRCSLRTPAPRRARPLPGADRPGPPSPKASDAA